MLAESSTEHNRRTRWESVFWIFFLLILLWLSKDFDKPLRYFPLGAAFWPKVVIYFMAIASAILFSSSFITRMEVENPQNSYLEEAPEDIAGVGWRTFSIFMTPLVWALIMHKVGFLLTAPFFIILFTRFVGVTDWRILLSYTIFFYSVIVLVFYKLIFTPLPMGAGNFHTITGQLIGLIQ